MTNIIIVDDHAVFREGIKLWIENDGLGCVIGEASNGMEFIDLLKSTHPDLVIMDIEMPVMNGVEATKLGLQMQPELKVLALSMHNDIQNQIDMTSVGALGYILKTSGKHEFENAIKSLIAGKYYLNSTLGL